MKLSFEKRLTFFFIVIISGMITLGIVSWQKNIAHEGYSRLVAHTHEVLQQSEKVLSIIKEFESGSRGYLATGDSAYLVYYDEAKDSIEVHVKKLKQLTQDNPLQQARIDSLIPLIHKRINFSQQTIQLKKTKNEKQALELMATRQGLHYMEQIRNLLSSIQKDENILLIERNNANNESAHVFNRIFFLLLIIGVAFLVISFLIIRNNLILRKKIEHELFIKNEWYDQTLISLGDGVITTDPNGVITLMNRSACDLSGWKKEEAIGNHIDMVFDITNERTGMKVINPLMEAMQKNKVIWLANHTILNRKNGSPVFIDDSGAPIHDKKGKMIGGVLIFRDVTEKKIAEQELIAANKKFSSIFNFSPVSLAITTIDKGEFMYVNDAFCEASGYRKEDIIGRTSIDIQIIDSHERELIVNQLKKNGGHGKDIEIKIRRANGRKIDILYSAQPIDVDNKPCYVYAMVDISERKKTEEEIKYLNESLERKVSERTVELSQSEKKYRNLFDNNPQPMWVYNMETLRFLNVNEAAIQHYGYTREEFLSMSLKEIRPFEDVDSLLKDISFPRAKLNPGGIWRHKKKNADIIYVEIISHQINYEGEDARLVLINDITERKKAEEDLLTKNMELQKTNTELDRFVYSASHDLRSPLTSLLGLIKITDENMPIDENAQKERLGMMKNTVVRLDNFIGEILNYSRNSRSEVLKNEVYFEDMIKETKEHLKFMDGDFGHKLKVEVVQPGRFVSDKGRISIVLNNLISNAIKYQDPSKENSFINISVQADESKAMLVVEDNGIGIAQKDHEKIFEMFYRATKLSSGSGLGMYILKEAVSKLNGTIQLESEIKKGSKFIVTLPNLMTE